MGTFHKKTVLVTGGAGFIGSNFILHLQSADPEIFIVNLDKLTYAGNLENLSRVDNSRYIFFQGDIASEEDVDAIFKGTHPNYLINFAAETHVDNSIHKSPLTFVETNVIGTANLLRAIRKFGGIEKAVFVSTDEVYGSLFNGAKRFVETDILNPRSPYSATKAAGDLLVLSHEKTFQLPVVVTRCCNNFGPRQHPEKFIPFLITRALEKKTLPVYGQGMNIREWIYVDEHAKALETILFGIGGIGHVFNIGSTFERTNIEIAHMIREYLAQVYDIISVIEYVDDRPGHDFRYALNCEKFEHTFGNILSLVRGKEYFKTMLEKTIDWYLDNQDWLFRIPQTYNKHII